MAFAVGLAAVIACGAAVAAAPPGDASAWLSRVPPNPLPSAQLVTLQGAPYRAPAPGGKWQLVFAWASWCPPCATGLATIDDYLKTHRDVTAIGLDTAEERPEQLARFLARRTFQFPLVKLPTAADATFMRSVPALPVIWIVRPDGATALARATPLQPAQLAALMRKAGYRAAALDGR